MFCPNCGHKINENEYFCPECGTRIFNNESDVNVRNNNQNNQQDSVNANNNININNNVNTNANVQSSLTLSEQLAKNNPLKPLMKKIKNFIVKYKVKLLIIIGVILAILIGYALFNRFYDFTKISWDESTGDINVSITHPTTLNLNVIALDKEKNNITDITFEVSDGTIESDGTKVKWTLPHKEGTYKITAKSPSGKKITKEVEVISLEDEPLGGLISEEVDDTVADNDNDGLTNEEENNIGTDPNSADTDKDGINDWYEINETKTDPLKADTDGDGINDGDELDLGLDPLKVDSKGDGINDGDRDLTYTMIDDKLGVELTINGKGNIASSTIDMFTNSTFASIDGLLDKVYNFYTSGTLTNAVVTIKYDIDEIEEKGLNEDNLTLYYFNDETKALEALPTTVDKDNKTIQVSLSHFSRYLIGDKTVVLTDTNTQIMFVIDNSVSMYSEDQMIALGYNSSVGAIGNDTTFKRLTLTNKIIDMFSGNYQFGVAEFSGSYVNLIKFTDSQTNAKESVNSMKNNWNSETNGTDIITALNSGISEFKADDNNHYIILLTDGKNNIGNLSSKKESIIESAKAKNIKVCIIGLGTDIDTDELEEIAESTDCAYYSATDSSALDEIYSIVGSSINYNYVDTDDDNSTDGMILADSGFIVRRDGFNFANFSTNKSDGGNCYGMATFAMLYYTNTLPVSLDANKISKIFLSLSASDGYDLTGTYFFTGGKLYEYEIETEALSNYLIKPADYFDKVVDDTLMIKEEYYNQFNKIGMTFSTTKITASNLKFSKRQRALLNIETDTFNNNVSKNDRELMSAIYRLFTLQADDTSTSFSSDPDDAFIQLQNNLSLGKPIVIGINGNHAINAIRLIQDNDDANKFKIEVYDNNFPGESRYIEVSRSKYSKWQLNYAAWVNEYNYTFMYDSDGDDVMEKTTVNLQYPNADSSTNSEYIGSSERWSGGNFDITDSLLNT